MKKYSFLAVWLMLWCVVGYASHTPPYSPVEVIENVSLNGPYIDYNPFVKEFLKHECFFALIEKDHVKNILVCFDPNEMCNEFTGYKACTF